MEQNQEITTLEFKIIKIMFVSRGIQREWWLQQTNNELVFEKLKISKLTQRFFIWKRFCNPRQTQPKNHDKNETSGNEKNKNLTKNT